MNPRLALFVTALLAPTAACIGGGDKDDDTDDTGTDPVVFTDEACTDVDLGTACPSEQEARQRLVGTETCESPVREVTETGEFLYSIDVTYTGYGGFAPIDTGTAEDTGYYGYTGYSHDATRCCYEANYRVHPNESCTIGRPLTIDGVAVHARATRRSDWCADLAPDLTDLDAPTRRRLAESWLRDALMEHASVPAFARVALELSALGAPPQLVLEANLAMADEVRHAQACFALASAYAAEPLGPGPLEAPGRPLPTLAQLAVETFREGCVGESLAVGRAAVQLRSATDPTVRSVLEEVIDDEGRHAELAWRIVRWAVQAGGDEVRQALREELTALRLAPLTEAPTSARGAAHGLAGAEALTPALEALLHEVVRPLTEELLAA